MEEVLLVVHAIVAVLLIAIILLQKSNTDGLKGIGGGDVNGSVLSHNSSSSILTKITVVLAIIFMVNCLVLGNLSARKSSKSIISQLAQEKINLVKKEQNIPMAE